MKLKLLAAIIIFASSFVVGPPTFATESCKQERDFQRYVSCIHYDAKRAKDIDICEEIPEDAEGEYGFSHSNIFKEASFPNDSQREYCVLEATHINDYSLGFCDSFESSYFRDRCLQKFADAKDDETICDHVQSDHLRKWCVARTPSNEESIKSLFTLEEAGSMAASLILLIVLALMIVTHFFAFKKNYWLLSLTAALIPGLALLLLFLVNHLELFFMVGFLHGWLFALIFINLGLSVAHLIDLGAYVENKIGSWLYLLIGLSVLPAFFITTAGSSAQLGYIWHLDYYFSRVYVVSRFFTNISMYGSSLVPAAIAFVVLLLLKRYKQAHAQKRIRVAKWLVFTEGALLTILLILAIAALSG